MNGPRVRRSDIIHPYQGGAGHVIIPATRRGAAWNNSNVDGGTGRALGEGWERREREGKKSGGGTGNLGQVVGRLFSYIEGIIRDNDPAGTYVPMLVRMGVLSFLLQLLLWLSK